MSEIQLKGSGSVENTADLFESNLLYELLLSQKEAARFLELAYLALREDPELARQVRNTADDAQNQHLRTHGLVREYQGTAVHVVKTMLPLIEVGIRKKKAVLVEKGLAKVLTYADDMIKRTKATVNEYYKIKTKVNTDISNVDAKNKAIKVREKAISAEMKEKKLEIERGEQDYKDIQSKTQSIEEKLKKLKLSRQEYIAESVKGESFFEGLFTTGMATFVTVIKGPEAGRTIFEGVSERKKQASKQAVDASEIVKEDIETEQNKIDENEKRMTKMKDDAIQSLVAMEKLALESADQMNEESLRLASEELGKVASLFAKILHFWEDFSSKLTALSRSHDNVELLIECIHDPDLHEDINESTTHVKKVWNSFGIMCTCYVDESERQLPELYAFMSHPIDQMAVSECNKRKQELLETHRAEIRALEGKIVPK